MVLLSLQVATKSRSPQQWSSTRILTILRALFSIFISAVDRKLELELQFFNWQLKCETEASSLEEVMSVNLESALQAKKSEQVILNFYNLHGQVWICGESNQLPF